MKGHTIIKFVGSGSAFVSYKKNWQSNVLVSRNGKNLLIDLGGDIRHALEDAGLSAADIDAFFLTHFHTDHIGGLEWLAFCTYFTPGKEPPAFYYPNDEFLKFMWGSIRNGVQSIEHKETTVSDFFSPVWMPKCRFAWEGIDFKAIQVIHTMNDNVLNQSYGLKFDLNGRSVFFSGDTQFAPNQYIDTLHEVDLILHDCETSLFESGVHSHYKRMFELPPEIKTKMWLYHFDDKPFNAADEGFAGWIERGATFE